MMDQQITPVVGISLHIKPIDDRYTPDELTLPSIDEISEYEVDNIHDEQETQEDIYNQTCQPILEAFLKGYNCSILLHGGPGTGKSHILEGTRSITSANTGIMHRFVASTLQYNSTSSIKNNIELYITCSGLTSGQDATIVDLLSSNSIPKSIKNITMHSYTNKLAARHIATIEEFSSTLEEIKIRRAGFLETASSNTTINGYRRKTPSINIMYTLKMIHHDKTSSLSCHLENKMTFVELASIENNKHHTIDKQQSLESRYQTSGFGALTGVMLALNQQREVNLISNTNSAFNHIPWRDHPLTRWLKDNLCQSYLIWFIATLDASPLRKNETLATLDYVQRLRSNKNVMGIKVTPTWKKQCCVFNQCTTNKTRCVCHTCGKKDNIKTCHCHCHHHHQNNKLWFIRKDCRPLVMRLETEIGSSHNKRSYAELLGLLRNTRGGIRGPALLERIIEESCDLKDALDIKKNETRHLTERLELVSLDLQKIEMENEKNKEILEKTRKKLSIAEDELYEEKETVIILKKKIETLNEKIGEYEAKTESLIDEKWKLKENLDNKVNEMEEIINKLKSKLEEESNALGFEKSVRNELEKEIQNMKNKYDELNRISEMNIKAIKKEKEEKEITLDEQKKIVQELKLELEQKEKNIMKLELNIEELNKLINNLKEQWEQQKKEFKKEIGDLKEQWINYRKIKKSIFNFSVMLTKEMNVEEYKNDMLENEAELDSFFKHIVKDVRNLKLKLAETENKFANENQKYMKYKEEAEEDYNELEKEVVLQNKHIKKIEKENEEIQYKYNLLEHETTLNHNLIKDYKNEQTSLKEKIQNCEIKIKSYIQNISEQKGEIETLSNEKIKLINEKSDLNKALENIKEEFKEKTIEMENYGEEKDKIEEKLNNTCLEKEALFKQMKSMKKSLKDFENDYEDLFLKYEDTQNKLNIIKKEFNLKSSELLNMIKKEEKTKNELDKSKSEMEEILKKHSKEEIMVNKKIKNCENNVEELSDEMAKMIVERTELEEQVKSVTEENRIIKEENKNMKETMEKNEDNHKQIKKNMINLKNEASELANYKHKSSYIINELKCQLQESNTALSTLKRRYEVINYEYLALEAKLKVYDEIEYVKNDDTNLDITLKSDDQKKIVKWNPNVIIEENDYIDDDNELDDNEIDNASLFSKTSKILQEIEETLKIDINSI